MAATSSMLPLGTKAPDFKLFDPTSNKELSLNELQSDVATVVMFLCNHCPYVKYIEHQLIETVKQYQQLGISFIAINANDALAYPDDSPEKMAETAQKNKYTFPYLYDESQTIAKAYQAACTPDFYVFDSNLLCVYRGRFDDATPGNQKIVTGIELKNALDNLITGQPVDQNQKPSVGCSIKWKKK